jgi:hypothetical protein
MSDVGRNFVTSSSDSIIVRAGFCQRALFVVPGGTNMVKVPLSGAEARLYVWETTRDGLIITDQWVSDSHCNFRVYNTTTAPIDFFLGENVVQGLKKLRLV